MRSHAAKGMQADWLSMASRPRSVAETKLRREAELQQRMLADRLAELGQGPGGSVGKGATELPSDVADEIATEIYNRIRDLRRQIADLRRMSRTPPGDGPIPEGGWNLD